MQGTCLVLFGKGLLRGAARDQLGTCRRLHIGASILWPCHVIGYEIINGTLHATCLVFVMGVVHVYFLGCSQPLTPTLHFSDLSMSVPGYNEMLARALKALVLTGDELASFYNGLKCEPQEVGTSAGAGKPRLPASSARTSSQIRKQGAPAKTMPRNANVAQGVPYALQGR